MKEITEILTPAPGPAYRLLDQFIGTWETTGNMKTGNDQPDMKIIGTDVYEWRPGGYFILHTVDVMIGEDRKQSIEVIGFDASTHSYPMHSYDDQGETGILHATEHHGIWTFSSDELRFTGAFNDDRTTISGIWERMTDDSWQLLMDIKLTKMC